jgi:plastocyanin
MRNSFWRLCCGLSLIGSLSSCAPDPSDLVAPTTTAPNVALTGVTVRVRAIDNNFRPQKLEVHVGDLVEFTNGGRNDHDITPSDGGGSWGIKLADFVPKAVYEHVFAAAGDYPYYCTIHGSNKKGMIGTITVLP